MSQADLGLQEQQLPRWEVRQQDAVELLRSLAPKSVDLIVTDPAYESLEKHRAIGTTTRLKKSAASSNEWFDIFRNERFPEFFAECFRVLKKDAHLYMMCDEETVFVAKPMAEAVGFKFWKTLVWDKVTMGMGYHYRNRTERIMFLEKGHRNLNDRGISDIITAKRVRGGWPTEKPVDLLRILVRQSTASDELVVDPFCGSGATGHAALLEGRRFIGGDTSEKAVARATERLRYIYAEPIAERGGAVPEPLYVVYDSVTNDWLGEDGWWTKEPDNISTYLTAGEAIRALEECDPDGLLHRLSVREVQDD